MNKQILKYTVLIGLIVAITLFIFGNSLYDYDKSRDTSDAVAEIILPDKYITNETASQIIRKLAHLIEYAALGCSVNIFVLIIQNSAKKQYYGNALFYVLAVAVTDEHIQSFSDRTSSTGDIILDFFGAMIGFLLGWIFVRIYSVIKRRLVEATNRR